MGGICMNYFKHHVNRPTGRVWSLFTELSKANESMKLNQKKKVGVEFSHTLEIVNAALSGSIQLDDDSIDTFNLSAYEFACQENEKIVKCAKVNKELFIVDDYNSESDTEKRVGFGDISMRRLGTKDKNLEEIINSEAFGESLSQLLGIRSTVAVDYGVDIVRALYGALIGTVGAVELVRKVTEQNKQVEEIITTLCNSSRSGELQGRLQAVM